MAQVIAGVDIAYNSLKTFALVKKGAKYRLVGYNTAPIPEDSWTPDELKNTEEIAKVISETFRTAKPHPVTAKQIMVALPERVVFSGTFSVPNYNTRELRKSLPYEVAEKLSVSLDDYVIDYELTNSACRPIAGVEHKSQADDKAPKPPADSEKAGQPTDQTNQVAVFAVATKRSLVDSIIELGEMAKMEIAGIDIKPGTIARAVCPNDHRLRLVIELGATTTVVVVAEGQSLHLTSSVPIGVQGNVPAAKMDVTTLQSSIGPVIEEIAHVKKFFEGRICPGGQISEIILTGGGANIAGVDRLFTDQTGIPSKIGDPLRNVIYGKNAISPEVGRMFTDCVGLAMRGLHD